MPENITLNISLSEMWKAVKHCPKCSKKVKELISKEVTKQQSKRLDKTITDALEKG